MLMKYKLRSVIIIFLMLFLVGCGTSSNNDLEEQTNKQDDSKKQNEEYTPTKALPEGIPVYPGAILSNEIGGSVNSWQWLYQTTGSGKEIMTFFINELMALGFEIDNYSTTANYEEFFVVTEDQIIRVYWLDTDSIADIDNVTPDTPNRGYSIVVNLPEWENR